MTTTRTIGRDRAKLCQLFSVSDNHLVIPHQVHGSQVLYVSPETTERPTCDALWTDHPGLCIGVSTADCVPILLSDGQRIAAVHAGWRGTLQRILHNVPMDWAHTRAAIGPAISLQRFEVGDEVYDAFATNGFDMSLIAQRFNRWHIDLKECNRQQLLQLGVPTDNIHVSPLCTYDSPTLLFSARREQTNTSVKCGRNFNALCLL